mmetsp:Transcript_59444/g.123033  ORF Transcript_59444/g.123033 Transcript_59444/m.123033 type:complete len:93 (-) Transcript_59444:7-285(-)
MIPRPADVSKDVPKAAQFVDSELTLLSAWYSAGTSESVARVAMTPAQDDGRGRVSPDCRESSISIESNLQDSHKSLQPIIAKLAPCTDPRDS